MDTGVGGVNPGGDIEDIMGDVDPVHGVEEVEEVEDTVKPYYRIIKSIV